MYRRSWSASPGRSLGLNSGPMDLGRDFHLMSHLTGPALCAFTIIIVIPISF